MDWQELFRTFFKKRSEALLHLACSSKQESREGNVWPASEVSRVGSQPHPFRDGSDGSSLPSAGGCAAVDDAARDNQFDLGSGDGRGLNRELHEILVTAVKSAC